MSDLIDYCTDCKNAKIDYCEYVGRYKQFFIDGCKKDLEPYFNDEEECIECEGKEYIDERLD